MPEIMQRDFILQGMPKGSVCAEIGVYRGDFAKRILETVQPEKLHLIDPWKYEDDDTYSDSWYGGVAGENQEKMDRIFESVKERFGSYVDDATVELHRCMSSQAASVFDNEYFDWVYIDGNHQYEFVKEDLGQYYWKVKRGGYIAGDDYGVQEWWGDGVTRAVHEFLAKNLCKVVIMANGQFVLIKT